MHTIQNKDGNFVLPSINSTIAAVDASATTLPKGSEPWTNVTLTNAPGQNSYPISSFTYLILYKELSANPSINEQKAKSIVDFIYWAITDGQKYSKPLGYVPLPASVVDLNKQTLNSLTFNGNPISTHNFFSI